MSFDILPADVTNLIQDYAFGIFYFKKHKKKFTRCMVELKRLMRWEAHIDHRDDSYVKIYYLVGVKCPFNEFLFTHFLENRGDTNGVFDDRGELIRLPQ